MTILSRLKQWTDQEKITPAQYARLAALARGEPFSLFLELNVLLYAGVLAFVAGLGWTATTWSRQIGDVVILTILSGLFSVCLWYCSSRVPAWSPAEMPVPNPLVDYVLYLGSLVWGVELAYLENRFLLLSGQGDLCLLATAGLFFFLAYRFDNRLVLSLGLSSLAGWFGLTISHWPNHQDAAYRQYALLYCLLVGVGAAFFHHRGLKPHFFTTYLKWRRFGFWYAFPAAMVFIVFLPGYWTSSHSAQHLIVAAFYAAALMAVIVIRPRHRFDYLNETYSLAEAFLWLGIYLAINLKLSSLDMPARWWQDSMVATSEFAKPFYWTTWILIWCLPPIVLTRGVRQKDRFVIAAGAIIGVLTFISNKPYLDWHRHTWDPMLLGIVLAGAALFIRRWLARGPSGTRRGFTAARLSGKEKQWMDAGSAALGLVSPHSIVPAPQAKSPGVQFGGGSSGGGGASSDF